MDRPLEIAFLRRYHDATPLAIVAIQTPEQLRDEVAKLEKSRLTLVVRARGRWNLVNPRQGERGISPTRVVNVMVGFRLPQRVAARLFGLCLNARNCSERFDDQLQSIAEFAANSARGKPE